MPYQMKSGKWRAKKMIHGVVKTKVFDTKQEAKKWEAVQEAADWSAKDSATRTISLAEFATAYLDMAKDRFARTTYNEKALAFRHLFKAVHPTAPPEALTATTALEVLRKISLEVSSKSANNARKNYLAAWEWGRKFYGLPALCPFKEVDRFPANETPRYVPSETDFWRVYEAALPTDRAMLLLTLHTGARRGEVFKLKWSDVDLTGRKIRLGTRKTGHGGIEYSWVPMTTELQTALGYHKLHGIRKGEDYVFPSPRTRIAFKNRCRWIKALCKKAGVKPFGFHAIRHLSATILAHEGLDIPSVQAILRHKNPNTTARYIKSLGVQPDKLDRIFENRRGAKVLSFEAHKKAIGT